VSIKPSSIYSNASPSFKPLLFLDIQLSLLPAFRSYALSSAYSMSETSMSNYLFKIDLTPGQITSPRISWTLSVPATYTFTQFHRAIQTAFEWSDEHAFNFDIWSSTKLSGNNSLKGHKLMNLTDWSMGGHHKEESNNPTHIQENLDRARAGLDYRRRLVPAKNVRTTRLCDVLERSRYNGKLISYLYDFGDDWQHFINPKGRAEPTEYPVCVAGTGHAAGEDIGGSDCWEALKETYNKQGRLTAEEKETIWRYENICGNGDPLGLANGRERVWDRDLVNERLRELRDSEDEDSEDEESMSGEERMADWARLSEEAMVDNERECREMEERRRQWEEEERLEIE